MTYFNGNNAFKDLQPVLLLAVSTMVVALYPDKQSFPGMNGYGLGPKYWTQTMTMNSTVPAITPAMTLMHSTVLALAPPMD